LKNHQNESAGAFLEWVERVDFVMRRIGWTPSTVPNGDDQNVYLVLDGLGGSQVSRNRRRA
jgi:hypothetical protein